MEEQLPNLLQKEAAGPRGAGGSKSCREGVPAPQCLVQRGPTFWGPRGKRKKRGAEQGERAAGSAGWSGKHFPARGAKSYKYSWHCNCVTRLLSDTGSATQGTGRSGLSRPQGAPARPSPPGPCPQAGEPPGLRGEDFGAGEDKEPKVGGSAGSAASGWESAARGGQHLAPAPNTQTRYF